MTRIYSSLVVAAALLVPSAHAWIWGWGRVVNFRSGEIYTTVNDYQNLTTPGNEIFISPEDSFDFVPEAGYGVLESAQKGEKREGEVGKLLFDMSGTSFKEWAMSQLQESKLIKTEAPTPNESLVGRTLTIESAQEVLPRSRAVACHMIDKEASFCHLTPEGVEVTVTAVQVSPHGKPSSLNILCHHNTGADIHRCHVMNVGDILFTPTPGVTTTTVGEMRKELKSGDITFLMESHVMQSKEGTDETLKLLASLATENLDDITSSPHYVVSVMIDDTSQKMIHNPSSPVTAMNYDAGNVDLDVLFDNAKVETIAITYYIPADKESSLEKIIESEAILVKKTMEMQKMMALNNNYNLRSKLEDYTNGPCKDMIILFSSTDEYVDVKS